MKPTWGKEIWEDKVRAQGSVGVILGTGFSQNKLDRLTQSALNLCERTLLKRLTPGATILDVGVGPAARFTLALAERGFRPTGLDASPTTLKMARDLAQHAGLQAQTDFIEADFSEFKVDRPFDAIFCVETFFHIPAHLELDAFRSFNRALKPGGVAWVQFAILDELNLKFLAYNFFYRLAYIILRPLLSRAGRKSFCVTVNRNSRAEVEDIARRTGFKICGVEHDHYLFEKTAAV